MSIIKSDLIDFELTKENCFICGNPATTVEHLFPKWLQRKFNLWDQKITIPNSTTVTYKKLIVPACNRCNNEIYGSLEDRIKNNQADDNNNVMFKNIKDAALNSESIREAIHGVVFYFSQLEDYSGLSTDITNDLFVLNQLYKDLKDKEVANFINQTT